MKNNSKEITGVIYKFQNKLNNKIYIGQSRCEKSRYSRHVNCKKPRYEIDRAIKYYGIENFTYEIVEAFSSYILDDVNNWMDEKEEFYIKKFNSLSPNGYNLLSSKKHPEFSETTRKKIAEACKGEKNGFYGKKHSEETRKKMRESAQKRDNTNYLGRKPSEKQLEKYKQSMKKYWENISPERRAEVALIRKTGIKKWRDNISQEDLQEMYKKRTEKLKETRKGKVYLNSYGHNTKAILYYYDNVYVQEFKSISEIIKTDLIKEIPKTPLYKKLKNKKTLEKYNLYNFVYKDDILEFSNKYNELKTIYNTK